jgi:phosphodiesterase/alkaline phosphatase D-like protein
MLPEPIQNLGVIAASDRYEGYAAERAALLKFIDDNNISNVVFVSADIHGTLVNNLTYQLGPGLPQIPTNAFEISTGSVAYDAPFGPTVLQLAAAVPVAPGLSLLDVFLAQLGLPNIEAFNALPEIVKNNAL